MAQFEINGAMVDSKFFTKDQKDDHKLVDRVAKA